MYKYIKCFAENKKDVEMSLSSTIDICIQHILYLILFPGSAYTYHWEHEVYSFFSKSPKLKGTNKFPNKSQIYSWTYGKRSDVVTDIPYMTVLIQTCCEEEDYFDIYNASSVSSVLDDVCTKYFNWLSTELSTVGIISPSASRETLHAILEQHGFSDIVEDSDIYKYPIKLSESNDLYEK